MILGIEGAKRACEEEVKGRWAVRGTWRGRPFKSAMSAPGLPLTLPTETIEGPLKVGGPHVARSFVILIFMVIFVFYSLNRF